MFQQDDWLVFDCDAVLACVNQGQLDACAAVSGKPCAGMQWTTYDQFVEFGLSHKQFLQALIDHRVLENALVRPGVRAALTLAKRLGLQIGIVTARGFHPNPRVTEEWASRHGLPIDAVKVVRGDESKVDAIRSLGGRVVAYSDDLAGHLSDVSKAGLDIPLYLMHQAWNADFGAEAAGFTRVASVPEYVDHVLAHYQKLDRRHPVPA